MLILIIASSNYLAITYYLNNTKEAPDYGGEYVEGMVGQPRFINPVLAQTNDIDSDLSTLIYSGLMKIDEKGNLVNDIAERYEISEDKLVYTFYLKKGVKWHDGKDLTADDVIFTLQTIQNKDFNSPLRTNWKGIRAEKIDDHAIKFTLKNAYSPFLNNLTFGILPKHLWEFIGSGNFPLAEYNLTKPVGSGPYKFKQFSKDKSGRINSIELASNENYYFKEPYIKKVIIKFFQNEDEIISAFNRREIKGINYILPSSRKNIVDSENTNIYRLNIPRYFAIFFNQTKSKPLSDKAVRIALAHAVDRKKLVDEVYSGEGVIVDSPIPSQIMGSNPDVKTYEYSAEEAKNILENAGWKDGDGDGIREKDGVKIEFSLITTDWQEAKEVSLKLRDMWKEIGANVEIKNLDINDIQNNYVKQRSYEALLFGEILNYDPDPFAFWHSSQKKDPGLNYSLYDNPEADKLLEEARQETDQSLKIEKYKKFQELVVEDMPAIFLYSPYYLYVQNRSIGGTNLNSIVIPSNRFNGIENWYAKTKRLWK
ncbi:MAG: peptide ABC transporter substrate-binding protein [Candidatus Paceibacterota bacterium]|jgi:peptide/nickel transport system substrate-binding protein